MQACAFLSQYEGLKSIRILIEAECTMIYFLSGFKRHKGCCLNTPQASLLYGLSSLTQWFSVFLLVGIQTNHDRFFRLSDFIENMFYEPVEGS